MTSPSESSQTTPEQVEQPEKPLLDRLKALGDLALAARRAEYDARVAARVEQAQIISELRKALRGKTIRFSGQLHLEDTLLQNGYALDYSHARVKNLTAFVTYVADGFSDGSLGVDPILYINRGESYTPGCGAAVRLSGLESIEVLPEKPAEA